MGYLKNCWQPVRSNVDLKTNECCMLNGKLSIVFGRLVFVFLLFTIGISHAQTLDTLTFGDSASEGNHNLRDSFYSVTPASYVTAGGGITPSDPSSTPPSATVTGALGLSGRQLLPRTPNADLYGGQIAFTMTVDPVKQNYLTVKFWGSDTATNEWFVLDCNGLEVGSRHGSQSTRANSEGEIFWNFNTSWSPNTFVYRTRALPLSVTQGQTSVVLTIRSLGMLAYYTTTGYFNQYAKLMQSSSPTLYTAYTHTGAFLDNSSEAKGAGVSPLSPAPGTTSSQAIASIESTVNSTVANYLNQQPGTLTPDQIDYLAESYGTTWSSYAGSSALVNAVIADIDGLVQAYSASPNTYMGAFVDSSWGGYFGPVGDAIRRMWPQISSGSTMSTVVNYGGALGSVSRTAAWSAALRASLDFGRFNRKTFTNQILSCDSSIYMTNRGLELVDPNNALLESEALRYLHEASGLSPYLGSDQPGGGQTPIRGTGPFGPNWYTITSKGTSKEPGFVGSDYGEIGGLIFRMGMISGDSQVQQQGLKALQARTHFRYAGTDSNGYQVMMGPEPVGDRNDQEMPGHVAYLGRFTADDFLVASQGAGIIGPNLLGYFQQGLNSGEGWPVAVANGYGNFLNGASQIPLIPDYWSTASAQSQTSSLLPQTFGAGLPDFGWADEENMAVSAKHGSGTNEESFYANMNWLTPPYINGLAKVFDWTSTEARTGEVMLQDEQFDDSGFNLYGSYIVDWDRTPWDNPQSAYGGILYAEAIRPDLTVLPSPNADGGRGTGYTLRYGHWLVGMNASPTATYTVQLPTGFISATDLVSGSSLSGPVTIAPKTTVVFYLPTTIDSCAFPTAPLNINYSATSSSVTLTWSVVAGATSYNVSRASTSGSAFAVIASGITGTTYTDNIALSTSTAPYYVVTATNSCGTGGTSGTVGPVQSTQLPGVVSSQDIGTVGIAGSSTYTNGVFSVSGSGTDIGGTSDSFQYAYATMSTDGDFVTRLTDSEAAKSGLMIRASLTSDSAMGMVMVDNSASAVRFVSRSNNSSSASYTTGLSVADGPVWLRLNKAGSTLTAYSSVDGISWSTVASANISYGTQYYVGFAVTSRSTIPATATFDSFLGVSMPGNALPLALADLDIGGVNVPGFTTYTNGLYDATASGTGITSTTDSFHFTYAQVSTDGDYITQVLNRDASQEAIMVRSSLTASSAMAMVSVSNSRVGFAARGSAGATLASTSGSAVVSPLFLRLNKSGSQLTGYSSTDGFNWTQISSATISIGSQFYVGLANASGGTTTQSGLFTGLAGVPSPLNLQVTPLSSNYLDPISVSVAVTNTQNVTPTGTASIYDWGTLLTTLPLSGGAASWSVSPSLLAGIHNLQAVYSGDSTYPQQTSPVVVATVSLAPGQSGPCPLPSAPVSVNYAANNSDVFLTWNAVKDTASYTISRSLTPGSGFAVIATNVTSPNFTDAFSATTPANAPYYVITAVNACGSGSASVEIGPVQSTQLPNNFSNQDVGTVQTPGTSAYTNGVFSVSGSGADIGGTSDSFQYAYAAVSSDGDFITRLVTSNAPKAGLMIRASTAASSAFAYIELNSTNVVFSTRTSTGGTASIINGPTSSTAPLWLRLNKLGASTTAYSSIDGVTWTKVGSASITYGSQYDVGFAVTSRASSLATATFDSVLGIATPANVLPSAFTVQDIGTVGTPGGATYQNGLYNVSGSGTDISSTSDSFQFSSVAMSADGDYVVQVLNQDAVKQGIMIRNSLSANSAMAVVMLNTGMARFAVRSTTGGSAIYTNGTTVSTNPVWLKLNKTGNTITGYSSFDKANWTTIASSTITVGTRFYVGFAVTSRASNTQSGMFAGLSGIPAPLILQLSTTNAPYGTNETITVTPVNTQNAIPTGTVAIYDSMTLVGTFPLNSGTATGVLSPSLTVGTHSLTAVYSGDTIYPQQCSVSQTVTVTQ